MESQERWAAIGGLFHDRDDADRFVWMRGFARRRPEALAAGRRLAAWPAANATMVDSDRRLRCGLRGSASIQPAAPRALVAPLAGGRGLERCTAWLHETLADGTCDTGWPARCSPRSRALGTNVAAWRTEPAENTFPALPVRGDMPSSGPPPSPTTRRTPPPSPPSPCDPTW